MANASALYSGALDSPLGPLHAVAGDAGLALLEFAEPQRLDAQLAALRRHFDIEPQPGAHPLLHQLAGELDAYFAGQLRAFTTPLQMPGSPFQRRVWAALLQIPYGQTRSYEALAQTLGDGAATRAVGSANGANRLAIVVPCHRVLNKSGALGGYGGGLWRKQQLLALEARTAFALRG